MICPYCGKVAYWYEVKIGKDKPKIYACCEKAKEVTNGRDGRETGS